MDEDARFKADFGQDYTPNDDGQHANLAVKCKLLCIYDEFVMKYEPMELIALMQQEVLSHTFVTPHGSGDRRRAEVDDACKWWACLLVLSAYDNHSA